MRVLITGKCGQLACELEKSVPENVDIITFDSLKLDITNQAMVNEVLITHSPDIVINAAAYTAVDQAEVDKEAAHAVNENGSKYLALVCKEIDAQLIHISTDFVFDGTQTTPYQTHDKPNPINIYGESKLQGETKIGQILGEQAIIIRTAWLYSVSGNNFVTTMLRLMAEKDQLSIVYDQVGTPTWAKGLAEMIWALVQAQGTRNKNQDTLLCERALNFEPTILHWTDAGVASWYDFAVAIQELALKKGLLDKAIPIRPIPASSYPTLAKRPNFSVMDKVSAEMASGVETKHWMSQLSIMMDELKILRSK